MFRLEADGYGQIHSQEMMTLVFGLDIGTRSIVGVVGYLAQEPFFRLWQWLKQKHATRAMLDGQIHDIYKVGDTIQTGKEQSRESARMGTLTDVCIAAAGRVIKNC